MNVLALIPARNGSKGIYKKNIKLFNEKPLISYTIEAAKKSKYINRIIVSTDSEEISTISKKYGAETPFLRPSELSGDNSPSIDTVLHCIDYLKKNEDYEPDIICLLQCTSPLRKAGQIDEAVDLLKNSGKDSLVSVCENDKTPYWMRMIKDGKLCEILEGSIFYTRRQDIPKTYRFNGSIYIIKTKILLRTRLLHDENSIPFIMDKLTSIDIDDEIDFSIAEFLYRNYLSNSRLVENTGY